MTCAPAYTLKASGAAQCSHRETSVSNNGSDEYFKGFRELLLFRHKKRRFDCWQSNNIFWYDVSSLILLSFVSIFNCTSSQPSPSEVWTQFVTHYKKSMSCLLLYIKVPKVTHEKVTPFVVKGAPYCQKNLTSCWNQVDVWFSFCD